MGSRKMCTLGKEVQVVEDSIKETKDKGAEDDSINYEIIDMM